MTEFDTQQSSELSAIREGNADRLLKVLIVVLSLLGGAILGGGASHYTLGREVANLAGQVAQLNKIEQRVADNTTHLKALDIAVGKLEDQLPKHRRPR